MDHVVELTKAIYFLILCAGAYLSFCMSQEQKNKVASTEQMERDGDTDSECEFVERVEANLRKRGGGSDVLNARRALKAYSDLLRNESAIRELRMAHLHAQKTMSTKIMLIQRALQKLEGKHCDTPSELAGMLADPNSYKGPLQFALFLQEKTESELNKALEDAYAERDHESAAFERNLQDALGENQPLCTADMGLVRGFLVQKKSDKQSRLRKHKEAVSSSAVQKGDVLSQAKRAENSLFVAFFEAQKGKPFAMLTHSEVKELKGILSNADCNHSALIEADDFSKLVRRLLCDFGVTQKEIDRIALLCGLCVPQGFALDVEAFFDVSCKLLPVIDDKSEQFLVIEDETNEDLKQRQVLATADDKELFLVEQEYTRRMSQIRADTSKTVLEQEDLLLQEILKLEVARYTWARKAIILTVRELDRIRLQNIVAKARAQESVNAATAAAVAAPPVAAPADASATDSPLRKKRIPSAPSQRSSSAGSSRTRPSVSAILDVFKNSIRAALHRAPFIEVRSAGDIPNEKMEREFYQLFTVISKQEEFISTDHIVFLLNIFTPCGCDEDEARSFFREECDGSETLVFDEFIKYGLNLKHRLLAYETFASLESPALQRAHIEERIAPRGDRTEPLPLRRYEKDFFRTENAKISAAQIRKSREQPRRQAPQYRGAKMSSPAASIEGRPPHAEAHRTRADGSSSSTPAPESEAPDWEPQNTIGSTSNNNNKGTLVPVGAPTTSEPHRNEKPTSPSRSGHDGKTAVPSKRSLLPEKLLPILPFVEPSLPCVQKSRREQDDSLVLTLRQTLLS